MVSNILNQMANGATIDEVLESCPHMTREDVFAALAYAEAVVRDEEILPIAV